MKNEILSKLISVSDDGLSILNRSEFASFCDDFSDVLMQLQLCHNIPVDSSLYAFLHMSKAALQCASRRLYDIKSYESLGF